MDVDLSERAQLQAISPSRCCCGCCHPERSEGSRRIPLAISARTFSIHVSSAACVAVQRHLCLKVR